MAKDPTATAASRFADGSQRAAYIVTRNPDDGQPERTWLDPATVRALLRVGRTFRSPDGEKHYRINENAPEPSQGLEGQAPNEGHHS